MIQKDFIEEVFYMDLGFDDHKWDIPTRDVPTVLFLWEYQILS